MITNLLIMLMVALVPDSQSSPGTFKHRYRHSMTAARYLALGDSYTIGEGVEEQDRWPMQLAESLRDQNVAIGDPLIIARTGWTTDELDAAIDREKPEGPFDLVTLLIGVNNQYRGRSEQEYRTQFVHLLRRAIAFAGNNASRVIVLSIPDWSVTPYAEGRDRGNIAREIDLFNATNLAEAGRAGAQYVDITSISKEAIRDPSLLAADGLHPSGGMYGQWARLALPKALKALRSTP